ncbi:MAG: hypothetical protein HQK54_01520 [Oligoflexales bacterium]|nr:hypothetical protein [Oligoflexales bacterium]
MSENNNNEQQSANQLLVRNMLLKDRRPAFQAMIRHYALDRFQTISGFTDLHTEDHEKIDAFVYGAHQAMIIVSGNDVRIAFKAHFNYKNVLPLVRVLTGAEELTPRAKGLVIDTFREYTNLTAGAIKGELETLDMVTGISLPIFSSGYDEIISSDTLKPRRNYDYFRIKSKHLTFNCTVWFDVVNEQPVENYNFTPKGSEVSTNEDDGVDFL